MEVEEEKNIFESRKCLKKIKALRSDYSLILQTFELEILKEQGQNILKKLKEIFQIFTIESIEDELALGFSYFLSEEYEESLEIFKKFSSHYFAQNMIGEIYQKKKDSAKEYGEEMCKWFKFSYEHDYSLGNHNYALYLLKKKDLVDNALLILEKNAEKHPQSCISLAHYFINNFNIKKSLYYFRKAVNHGDNF